MCGVPHETRTVRTETVRQEQRPRPATMNGKPVEREEPPLPKRASDYPKQRYMGSKHRLLSWIHSVFRRLDFETAADPFCGSGCVAYLLKVMGKRVHASDFLNFPSVIASAAVQNSRYHLNEDDVATLLRSVANGPDFIARTFKGIFYTPSELRFLDRVSVNLAGLRHPQKRNLARTVMILSCLKKQPRGVFSVSDALSRYDDGRRDLRLSLEEHFLEQIQVFNAIVFDNGQRNEARQADVFSRRPRSIDLVYLDPPYVPRADDNCYVKRYHFLEGLSCYWQGLRIMPDTKVRKVEKPYTPFSYRRTAMEAFDRLFRLYRKSTIVLSYSSNGFPDLSDLEELMGRYKRTVDVYTKPHRYHFGTHAAVERSAVQEYLIVGQ